MKVQIVLPYFVYFYFFQSCLIDYITERLGTLWNACMLLSIYKRDLDSYVIKPKIYLYEELVQNSIPLILLVYSIIVALLLMPLYPVLYSASLPQTVHLHTESNY
jgi:hypothetical protein